jgi:O-antigen biosynthesis protein
MLDKLLSIFIKSNIAEMPAEKDLISIIVLTHSKFDLFTKCVELLVKTEKDSTFDYEIIVVDNGSKEEIKNKILSFLRNYPDIKLIRNAENLAYSYANDEGVKISGGNYYCFYNDDIMATKTNWLEELVRCMRRHKKAAVVGTKLLYPDGLIQAAGVAFHKSGKPFWMHTGEKADHWEAKKERQYQAISFSCVLVKKEVYDKVGGMEKLGRTAEYYAEDFDFCFKALSAGYEVWYCPKAEMVHYGGATMADIATKEKTRQYQIRFIEKWKSKIRAEYD